MRLGSRPSEARIAFPCIDCAGAIVVSGIVCLDTPASAFDDPVWGSAFERSEVILREGGVDIRIFNAAGDDD